MNAPTGGVGGLVTIQRIHAARPGAYPQSRLTVWAYMWYRTSLEYL